MTGLTGRYASALFDLADENNVLDDVAKDLGLLEELIDESDDFEFNQDFEIEEGTRSPGWIRYQKRIK